jgi:5,10-methylenetetrahydromethanopterin reductase
MPIEFWRMGPTPVPATDVARFAREFEETGWDGLAVGEAHGLLPDPYAILTAAAAATTRLKVGTAVAVPLRPPLLAAGAMANVQALSGGRARFCLGRGDGAVKILRSRPTRVADFEEYLARVCGFLRRDIVDLAGVPVSMARLDDIDPSLGVTAPPVDVAATGRKTVELAARHADGIDFSVGADVDRLQRSIAAARDAAAANDRDPESLEFGAYIQVAVTSDDDVSAREAIRGIVVTHARFSGFEATREESVTTEAHSEYRQAVEVMEAVYQAERGGATRIPGGRPGEIDFYPREAGADELIDAFAIAGDPAYCAQRISEIEQLGIKRLYIGTRSVGVDLDERNAHRIATEVLPLVRSRST